MTPQRAKTGDVWEAKIPAFQSAVKACGDKTYTLKDETSAIDGLRVGVPPCGDGNFTSWVSLYAWLHPRRRQRCDNHRETPSMRSASIRSDLSRLARKESGWDRFCASGVGKRGDVPDK
jgi:hypothetical protein